MHSPILRAVLGAVLFAVPGAAALSLTAAIPALAHAFLDHAVPSVGGEVPASPAQLTLAFTQKVVVALSAVTVGRAGGGSVAAGRLAGDGGSSSETLHLPLSRPLPPGRYVVSWRVVAIDTHATSGSYMFTVAP